MKLPFLTLLLLFSLRTFASGIDTCYCVYYLGSYETEPEHLFGDKYCRPRADLLKELTSEKTAKSALLQLYDTYRITKPEDILNAEAKICRKQLNILKTSGDSVWLRFIRPAFMTQSADMYMYSLNEAFAGINLFYAFKKHDDTREALDKKLDKAYMNFAASKDSLYAFHNTKEFTAEAYRLFRHLSDSLDGMKKELRKIDSTLIGSYTFMQLDTLMERLEKAYADTTSENFKNHHSEINLIVFSLDGAMSSIFFNASQLSEKNKLMQVKTHTPFDSVSFAWQKSIMIMQLDTINSYEFNNAISRTQTQYLPVKKGTFKNALAQYRKYEIETAELRKQRANLVNAKVGIHPLSKFICYPSANKDECKTF